MSKGKVVRTVLRPTESARGVAIALGARQQPLSLERAVLVKRGKVVASGYRKVKS